MLQGVLPDPGSEFPFVANSVAKDGTFAVLCWIAVADIRRHMWAVYVVIGAHVLLISGLLISLLFGNTESISGSFAAPFGIELPAAMTVLWIWLALAVAVTAFLAWMARRATKARYELLYLAPHQHRTLMALAEVLVIGPDERLTAEQVAANVDRYLASFPAAGEGKGEASPSPASALYPILRLRLPYPVMSSENAARVHRALLHRRRRRSPPARTSCAGPSRRCFTPPSSSPSSATTPTPAPPRRPATFPSPSGPRGGPATALATRPFPPLSVARRRRRSTPTGSTADVAIVGCGAAGALLAYRLAGARPRGAACSSAATTSTRAEFTDDESDQFAALYRDGGMQMSTDASLPRPAGQLRRRDDGRQQRRLLRAARAASSSAGTIRTVSTPVLGTAELADAFTRLRRARADRPDDLGRDHPGQPGAMKFRDGDRSALGLRRGPGKFDVVEANIADCLGCGYCNIGCPFGRKLSALDYMLPEAAAAVRRRACGSTAECRVERVVRANGTAASASIAMLDDGRRLRVGGRTPWSSPPGALASSMLLQRCEPAAGRTPAAACPSIIGAPMTADVRREARLLRRPADLALPASRRRRRLGAGDLVQPGRRAGAVHAGLVLRPLRATCARYDRMACTGVGRRHQARAAGVRVDRRRAR